MIRMATFQPQNMSEWQLHCVLKRASLIQYYDSFIKNVPGEIDVIMLSEADDEVLKGIMEKVGMAKKPIHVRQFRNTLLEWTKDPGKNEHVPSYLQKADDAAFALTAHSVTSTALSDIRSQLPQMQHEDNEKQTKLNEAFRICKSKKTGIQPQQATKSKQIQRVVKDQKQHELFPYYEELLNKTVLDKMVLDSLISRCILMIEDREEIIKPTTQRERNRVLLDILTKRPYSTFQMLKDVLKESNPHNLDVQELVSKMQCSESHAEHITCHDIIIHEHIVKLQKNYLMFVNDMESKTDILDHLYETGVLDTEEKEEIYNFSITRHESNRLLLSKLVRKGEDAYAQLLEALRRGAYTEFASAIEKTEVSDREIQWCQIAMKKRTEREKKKGKQYYVPVSHTNIQEIEHDEIIPGHIFEQFERRLSQWQVDDEQFVNITAEKKVMEDILIESTVTIVGNSGTGKSFLSRHVALAMMKQGYTIIPCDNPGDIRQWFKPGRKTLFVFDDVCGRYILNQQIYNDWKQRLDHITSLLKDKCCKIMVTCRLDVYKNEQFGKLSIFKTCSIDLSSEEFKLNAAEKLSLAEVYFKDIANKVTELSEKYEFFPLLCNLYHKQPSQKHVNISDFFSNPFGIFQNELDDWYSEGKAGKVKYCCLALCVMFNNTLSEENFNTKDSKIGTALGDLFEECELNKGTPVKSLHKSLKTFEGTYVVKEGNTYKIIHDMLFDFLASYFGRKMLQLFIEHAHVNFINERCLWKAADNVDTEENFAIGIPDKFIKTYIERLIKDWENGFVVNVFTNKNMTSLKFTEMFISCINKFDLSKKEALAYIEDNEFKDTALAVTCSCGVGNLVEWLISRNSDINHCGEGGIFPLLWACANGDVHVVKELLQHAADVNQCDNAGESSLFIASHGGHIDAVKVLIQHSADVNKCEKNGKSPLHAASQEGHIDVVKELLQHSAEVNKCDNDGESLLYTACQGGHVDVVEELLLHSPDVNKCRNGGFSPLYIASYFNKTQVVKILLQCAAIDINLCDKDGRSSLYWASQQGHVEVVNELLQHSASVNKCDINGESPLYTASQQGQVDVVKELLLHSPDVNKCSNEGSSPLNIASYFNKTEVVKILLPCASIDINLCDKDGFSSLYFASQEGHIDVVKELLLHSPDVNKCCNDGVSPLSTASYFNKTEVVKILLQCAAIDINLCDKDGRSSLYLAGQQGHVEVVKELLQHSAIVNKCVNNGESPLFTASQQGQVDVVKELLLHSTDVNKCRNSGFSPLSTASYFNKTQVVKILLQCAAIDINLCDKDGRSSLYWASQQGHVEVVNELLKHAADVNKCDNDGESPLYTASQEGHVVVVEELLLHLPDVNKCNKDGYLPLLMASFFNKTEVVKILLQCDEIDINLCDKNGYSSLHWASHRGHVDVVKELLLHSPDVNKCCNDGVSPLSTASSFNKTEVVNILLQCDEIDINLCDKDGCSSLYWASLKGHVDVVKKLLLHSADVNKCKNNGASPLYAASTKGRVEVVKELIKHEADVNKCQKDGASPLYVASFYNHVDVVKELLKHKADVNKCDNIGVSPVFIASLNGHVGNVQELLKYNADVNKCEDNGMSPLHVASYENNVEVCKVLLRCADILVNVNSDYGTSSLYYASQVGNIDVVKELLQYSANVNQCDKNGYSPLYEASEEGHADVVNELLQHSAKVNQCGTSGVSPLNIASVNGHVDVVQYLLSHSAEVEKCDNDNMSPLYSASQQGHINVVKELLQYSADVNKCSNDGASPLLIASYSNKKEIVKVLLQCDDVDINFSDEDGRTSLYWASQKGHTDIVRQLLKYSVDVNKCDNDGVSPLQIAQEYTQKEVETLLFQTNAQ